MRTRPFVASLSCVALLAAGAITAAPTPAVAATKKSPSTAQIRVVMVYAPPDGSAPAIAVFDDTASSGSSSSSSKKKPKPLLTAEFGDVTDFTKVPTGHTLRLAPDDAEDENSGLFIDQLKKGDKLTLVPYATDTDPEDFGLQMLTIVEHGKRRKAGDVAEWPKVDSTKATLMMFPGAMLSVADNFAVYVVTPGTGCLEAADPDEQDLGVGGNIPAFYVVDEGSVDVGLADIGCTDEVIIGPEPLDASAGDRVALIPYGTSDTDAQLLVLPVDTP